MGLYLAPPQNAMVLCADEKSQNQASGRTAPVLPTQPHLIERRSADYARAYPERELHLLMDNYAAHTTPEVKGWLAAKPRVTVHFTPRASWMNPVEVRFSVIERQAIHHGTVTSVEDLNVKIRTFIDLDAGVEKVLATHWRPDVGGRVVAQRAPASPGGKRALTLRL